MRVIWRESAVDSLLELDQWLETIDLPPLALYPKDTIHTYFDIQEPTFYIPGRQVYPWLTC